MGLKSLAACRPMSRLRRCRGYSETALGLRLRIRSHLRFGRPRAIFQSTKTPYGTRQAFTVILTRITRLWAGSSALYVGREGLPTDWLRQREPLPYWPFLAASEEACFD